MGLPAHSPGSGALSPLTDSFLDAKAQSARRISSYESNRARTGSSTSATLPAVPENKQKAQPAPQNKPPSSYKLADQRKLPRSASGLSGDWGRRVSGGSDSDDGVLTMDRPRPHGKGKEKENFTGGMRGIPEERTIKEARWVLDPTEMQLGSETWSNSLRIVLVLGHVTVEALEPILYNPAFANTLLLIGTYKPIPEIDALLSPSYLLSSSPDREVCPSIQPFQPSGKASGTDSHDLTVLLNEATTLAKQYRERTLLATRSRQGSFSSASKSPSSPGGRNKVFSGLRLGKTPSRRGSFDSTGGDRPLSSVSNGERTGIPSSMSSNSLRASNIAPSQNSRPRILSMSRDSILGGMFKLDGDARSLGEGQHLFDAVINFVPPMSMFKSERAMQNMLHQAVVITTGCVPTLVRNVGKSSNDEAPTLPITLLHVLPSQAPPALAPVLESFVLSLLPSFQARCSRELFGCVITPPVWFSPLVSVSPNAITEDGVSGAEVLLIGGVRCSHQVMKGQGRAEDFKPRAFLFSWETCVSMCGIIAECRRPSGLRTSTSASRSVSRQNSPGDPPSVSFNDVQARTPPQTFEHLLPTASTSNSSQPPISPPSLSSQPSSSPKPALFAPALQAIQTQNMHQRKSKLSAVAAASDLLNSPPTPDLDPSISSCSSSFALGETNSQGSGSGGSANATATGNGGDNVKQEEFGGEKWGDGKESKKKGGRRSVSGWFKRAIAKNIKA
ncbi:hypothetical protein AYX15_00941 [Cryptococcus neoformans]|nr:hypothetical protein AYX15_00941 [Cryptococcus neoformans var. grubii]